MKGIKAFTLAEVLITLGIIGVVAAITIPNLITTIQKRVYVEQLKEGYALVTEGFKRMLALEQVSDWEGTELYQAVEDNGGNTDIVAAETAARPILERYFKKAEFVSRENLRTETNCNKLVGTGVRFWNLSDRSQCSGNFNMQYILPNGMYMNLYLMAPCYTSSYTEEEIRNNGGRMTRMCGNLWLDINGKKGPNQWGRDGFIFVITQAGELVPMQGRDYFIYYGNFGVEEAIKRTQRNRCSTTNTSYNGNVCAARIMEADNWEMNY